MMNARWWTVLLACFTLGRASADEVELLSLDSSRVQGDFGSGILTLSSDGRFAAFDSAATNLVPGDTNNLQDLFVRDRLLGITTRVSVGTGGVQANNASFCPIITPDGKQVVFSSVATNLVPNDTNFDFDVFAHDLASGTTERVSVNSQGVQANGASFFPTVSADGRFVTFGSDATNLDGVDTNLRDDVFVRDRATGSTKRVSLGIGGEANGHSSFPIISADGRSISFESVANNLVANDTNGAADVFRHDRVTGETIRISVADDEAQALGGSNNIGIHLIALDGRYVAFTSGAANLVANDTNGLADVFVRDVTAGTTVRASLGAAGQEPDNHALWAALSGDGRYVAFETAATNLVAADPNASFDVLLRDLQNETTVLVSANAAGAVGNADSFAPAISTDGRHVGFNSVAANLVPGDTNQAADVFVRSRCWVEFQAFGMGLAGAGGFVPLLLGENGACDGGYALTLSKVLGGAAGTLFVGVAELEQSPVLGGTFYIDLSAASLGVPVVVSGRSGIIGAGTSTFPAAGVSAFTGTTLVLQFLAADPAAPAGVSMTNALRMAIEG